jgi:hypothetical protein
MKGLLLKDIYTMVKQLKFFLVMIVIFAIIPGYYSVSSFVIVYAAMLPVTAVAYDERSKWNRLAAMMPYSIKSLVFSKYILGYLMIGAAFLISVATQLITAAFTSNVYGLKEVTELVIVICIAIILLSVNMPLMFKLGVEKGRMAFILLTMATVIFLFSLKDVLFVWLMSADFSAPFAMAFCVVCAGFVNMISINVSMKLYKKKFA